MDIAYKFLHGCMISFLLGIYLGVVLLGYIGVGKSRLTVVNMQNTESMLVKPYNHNLHVFFHINNWKLPLPAPVYKHLLN